MLNRDDSLLEVGGALVQSHHFAVAQTTAGCHLYW